MGNLMCTLLVLKAALPASASSSLTSAQPILQGLRVNNANDGLVQLISIDEVATAGVSVDFGDLSVVRARPAAAAVLYPLSHEEIVKVVRASFQSPVPFPVTARGCGHSIRGQATAPDGVVVDMPSLGRHGASAGATQLDVSVEGRYIDAGGEQLWVDVLRASLAHGLTPVSWTDYLHLTVGGTLSNAGISGQAFRHGPQISNVQELDVITGTGATVTCSKEKDADLFHAVLGGLGQFGIITRARITLAPAPVKARCVRLLYTTAAALTADQQRLISLDRSSGGAVEVGRLLDYVEGLVYTQPPSSSFFPEADAARVAALAEEAGGVLYCLEGALYYGGDTGVSAADVDQRMVVLLRELRYAQGFVFVRDVAYDTFLDRVHADEQNLRAAGSWNVPHPWLILFLPRSRILDFADAVFHGVLRRSPAMGPVLIYPMNRTNEMSAVITEDDDEVFYTVGILLSAEKGKEARLEEQNGEIIPFCEEAGIPYKQYLPYYSSQAEWEKKHFGDNHWARFLERKRKYDPKAILSRGHGIFMSPLA